MPSRKETMLWIRTMPLSVMTERSRDLYLGRHLSFFSTYYCCCTIHRITYSNTTVRHTVYSKYPVEHRVSRQSFISSLFWLHNEREAKSDMTQALHSRPSRLSKFISPSSCIICQECNKPKIYKGRSHAKAGDILESALRNDSRLIRLLRRHISALTKPDKEAFGRNSTNTWGA